MPRFSTRSQLLQASDEEIEQFFAETTFEGEFSSEIKSKKHYCPVKVDK